MYGTLKASRSEITDWTLQKKRNRNDQDFMASAAGHRLYGCRHDSLTIARQLLQTISGLCPEKGQKRYIHVPVVTCPHSVAR
jgi:hypothetical protein